MDIAAFAGANRQQLLGLFSEAHANPDTAIPALVEHLRLIRRAPSSYYAHPGVAYQTPFCVFALLAQLQVTEAHADLVALLRLPSELLEGLLDDYLTEEFSKILFSTWDGQLDPLFSVVRGAHYPWAARTTALQTMVWIAVAHPQHRERVLQLLMGYLRVANDEHATFNEYALWGHAAYEIAKLLAPRSPGQQATLRALFVDDLADTSVADWDDIREYLDQTPEQLAQSQQEALAFVQRTPGDWLISWWLDDEQVLSAEEARRENAALEKELRQLHVQNKRDQRKKRRLRGKKRRRR